MADGAYGRAATYDSILARTPSARFIVPPCMGSFPGPTATISPTQRDLHVLAVDEHGRMNSQKATGYNTRSKVEAVISRYKRAIGDTLKSRHDTRRATEVRNCHQVPQPDEPTRACDIHSNSMIEAASTSRHAWQSLHATRSRRAAPFPDQCRKLFPFAVAQPHNIFLHENFLRSHDRRAGSANLDSGLSGIFA